MKKKREVGILLLLGCISVLVLLPNTLLWRYPPDRDPSVFMYVGQQILEGRVPYRDVWDHKGPLIYFINAIGLFLSRGSPWGVWFIEFLSLWFAGLVGYILMSRTYGKGAALWASTAWMLGLIWLEIGNMTEEFALPFQVLGLYLFHLSVTRGCTFWRSCFLGMTAAGAFLLRPNLIGVHLAIMACMVLSMIFGRRWRQLGWTFCAICLGVGGVVLPIAAYFVFHGCLGTFWDCAFRYNFAYVGVDGEGSIVGALINGSRQLPVLLTVSMAASAIELSPRWRSRKASPGEKPLMHVTLLGLPLVMYLSVMSGRAYPHYYVAWLPVMAPLAALYAHRAIQFLKSGLHAFSSRASCGVTARSRAGAKAVVALALLVLPLFLHFRWVGDTYMQAVWVHSKATVHQEAVAYVERATEKDDYVLVWGAETGVNFASGRRSPTRFVYQYPLYTPGYHTDGMVEEFLRDIAEKRPRIIIDASVSGMMIPPLNSSMETWSAMGYRALPKMKEVYGYIASRYRRTGEIGMDGEWAIYEYTGGEG